MRAIRVLLTAAIIAGASSLPGAERPATPDEQYGELFKDVQRAAVFPDQKTFVDCVPKGKPEAIVAAYQAEKARPGFSLKEFVAAHFLVPEKARPAEATAEHEEIIPHLQGLWKRLRRDPDRVVEGSSLLPLPHPYIVPGGRFREIYYWDSYFTMLGLRESGEEAMIEQMVKNFAYLIEHYGYIPNGNRSYFLSRSQPPYFSLMVDLLAARLGETVYLAYLNALEAEYSYWTDKTVSATRHTVTLADGSTLSRYYDQRDTPRPEAFAREEQVAARSRQAPPQLYRNLRAAAESGWDFSSRWMADGKSLETTRTTELAPVDLNCLLQHLEVTLATAYRVKGDATTARLYATRAEERKETILKSCWSKDLGFFVDYDLKDGRPGNALTLAGVMPLFFTLATAEQAQAVKEVIAAQFLKPGGVVTTLTHTGQQWDSPNGWAPLQWLTIHGLENYGFHELAQEIAQRWLRLNREVYARTGKMMEKYDVLNTHLEAGGGEYPSQDGFGWTNGVFLRLEREYGEKKGKTSADK